MDIHSKKKKTAALRNERFAREVPSHGDDYLLTLWSTLSIDCARGTKDEYTESRLDAVSSELRKRGLLFDGSEKFGAAQY